MAKTYNEISDKAKDLILHSEKTPHLKAHKEAILDHLSRKMLRKEYDKDNAKGYWMSHADVAAHDCCDVHGEPTDVWHKMFPEGTRKEAASHWEELNREHLKHRHDKHEALTEEGDVIVESAFTRLANKIKNKEGYSAKGAAGAAYEAGVKKYGKAGMARKAHHSESVYFAMLNAAINDKPADLKEAFKEAIEPSILDAIERMKDDLRQFVFKFSHGEDVTNEPVSEEFVNEASRALLANYAKGKKLANKHYWNFSKSPEGSAPVPHASGDFDMSGTYGHQA